jgi:eukaryotic-like serine/threonine-protein kinase
MGPSGGGLGGRYELREQIGAGGYSEVWRGTDVLLARPVAIKLLHLGYAQHAEALTRFRAEAQRAGALSHENVARVYDYGEPDPPDPPFLVMELVDGPSLAGALASGPLDPARSLDIVAQTASGLHAAHIAGLVHRDIKPGNLLLAPGGIVKITDFGIASAADAAPITRTGQLVGTPGYLAPERAVGAPATPASDLYALGVVAYECLAGAPPFTGPALAVALAHRERPLPPLPRWLPGDVAALVLELTAKDPADRPRTAGEVARRASQMAGRLAAGAAGQAGAADEDPAVTVAYQATRYPGVAPAAVTVEAGTPTRHLPVPPGGTGQPPIGPGGALPLWRRRPRGPAGRAALPVAAAVLVIVAAFLISSLINSGSVPHAGAVPSGSARPGPAKVATVDINPGPLLGQPVTAAAQRLRQQGLTVRVVWRHSDKQPTGTVLAVQPAGKLPVGNVVTLTVASAPHGHGNGHGKGHGDNQQGQQGGD